MTTFVDSRTCSRVAGELGINYADPHFQQWLAQMGIVVCTKPSRVDAEYGALRKTLGKFKRKHSTKTEGREVMKEYKTTAEYQWSRENENQRIAAKEEAFAQLIKLLFGWVAGKCRNLL